MRTRELTFENRDGIELTGTLEQPGDSQPRALVLFAHCFTCTRNIKAAVNISRALVDEGFGVFRFDFTGLGESEGDFAETNFSSNVSDLVDAASFLEDKHGRVEILLGHSLGGAAILQAAHEIRSAKVVATVAAPADPAHVTHLFDGSREEIEARGEAEVRLAGRPFRIRKQLIKDLESVEWRERVRRLRRPLLVFHSPVDETVNVSNASEIFEAALHPKSFISLNQADHLISNSRDSQFVGRMLAAFAEHYLPADSNETNSEKNSSSGRQVDYDLPVTAVITGEGLKTVLDAGGIRMQADEPADVKGGSGSAPTPYGYLAASLAACTAMTLRMYATMKKLSVDRIEVSVRHDRIHAKDCAECETREGKIDRLTRQLLIEGDIDDSVKDRMTEIADRCPVHRTLESEIHIETHRSSGNALD